MTTTLWIQNEWMNLKLKNQCLKHLCVDPPYTRASFLCWSRSAAQTLCTSIHTMVWKPPCWRRGASQALSKTFWWPSCPVVNCVFYILRNFENWFSDNFLIEKMERERERCNNILHIKLYWILTVN